MKRLIFILITFLATLSANNEPIIKLDESRGEIILKRNGSQVKVVAGMPLSPEDHIIVPNGAYAALSINETDVYYSYGNEDMTVRQFIKTSKQKQYNAFKRNLFAETNAPANSEKAGVRRGVHAVEKKSDENADSVTLTSKAVAEYLSSKVLNVIKDKGKFLGTNDLILTPVKQGKMVISFILENRSRNDLYVNVLQYCKSKNESTCCYLIYEGLDPYLLYLPAGNKIELPEFGFKSGKDFTYVLFGTKVPFDPNLIIKEIVKSHKETIDINILTGSAISITK